MRTEKLSVVELSSWDTITCRLVTTDVSEDIPASIIRVVQG